MFVLQRKLFLIKETQQPAMPVPEELRLTVEKGVVCLWHPRGAIRMTPDEFDALVVNGTLETVSET